MGFQKNTISNTFISLVCAFKTEPRNLETIGLIYEHSENANVHSYGDISYALSSITRVTTPTATVLPDDLRKTRPRALQVEASSTQTAACKAT